jgi:FKBP-type peptidyl-prolyl cis-trans isomerase FklB
LKEGDGKAKPTASSTANVTYTGKLMDGTVFDSTDKNGGKPIELNLSGVIKGWTEGIQLMSKGAKYRFYIPSELAYGDNGAGGVIPPGAALIFDVELVDFK